MLFNISPNICSTPKSLNFAVIAATKILRSDVYSLALTTIFDNVKPHIDSEKLKDLVSVDKIFDVEHIRRSEGIPYRAQVIRQYNPWGIYLNPLLLVEMNDREREESELLEHPEMSQIDMISVHDPYFENKPKKRIFNSLVYSKQTTSHDQPATKKAKTMKHPPPACGPLSILELDTLMLTILLVHEASHLINILLSSYVNESSVQEGVFVTPPKQYSGYVLNDLGHMIEKEIFGYVIQHCIDKHYPTPFGIYHIVGCENESTADGYVLAPTSSMRDLLNGNDIEITAEALKLVRHGNVPFVAARHQVKVYETLSRYSSSAALADLSHEKVTEKEEDDEEEDEETNFSSFGDVISKYMKS